MKLFKSKAVFSLLIIGVFLALTTGQVLADNLEMAMITNVSGLGDGGFNDMAWDGFLKAEEELGADIHVIESQDATQYVPNLSMAAEQDYDMVVAVGFLLIDALTEAAPTYPDTNYVMIDGEVNEPNVASVLFKENEAAFLAGAIAGLMTETDKVGYVGGMETPPPIRFESGYRAGVKTTNPDAEVVVAYVGAFDDPGAAKETALSLYDKDVDIIHEVAGMSGLGVIEAAKETENWFIACDRDKKEEGEGYQLTAAMKRIDNAIMEIAQMIEDDEFEGGVYNLGLKDNAVGLPDHTVDNVGEEIMEKVNEYKQMIIDGEIDVPSNREELEEFTPPAN